VSIFFRLPMEGSGDTPVTPAPLPDVPITDLVKRGRALLSTLNSRPLRDADTATIRDCTGLFMEAYPKLYTTESPSPQHLVFHTETLGALQRHLWDLSVDRDVLFGYLLQSLVTTVLLQTSAARAPLVALNKNPRLQPFPIESKYLNGHSYTIPEAYQPTELKATAERLVADLLLALQAPAKLSVTRAICVVHALAKIARLRPALWPKLLPGLCELAGTMAAASPDEAIHRSPSVQYAVRGALVLLLRIPLTAPWRRSLQRGAEALGTVLQAAGMLSTRSDETLRSYVRAVCRDEDPKAPAGPAPPKRLRVVSPPPRTSAPSEPLPSPASTAATPIAAVVEVAPTPIIEQLPLPEADRSPEDHPALPHSHPLRPVAPPRPHAPSPAASPAPDPTVPPALSQDSPAPSVEDYRLDCLMASLKAMTGQGIRDAHANGLRRIVAAKVLIYKQTSSFPIQMTCLST